MVQRHELKTIPSFFEEIWRGEKTFEFRKNDRGFTVGDGLILREWAQSSQYTGREIDVVVTSMLEGSVWPGIARGYVIMSFRVISRRDAAK